MTPKDKIISILATRISYDEQADAIVGAIASEVLMPEYQRWRDVDGLIGIGASGAIANAIAKLLGLTSEDKTDE